MKRTPLLVAVLTLCVSSAVSYGREELPLKIEVPAPVNLAPKAKITADSEYSGSYLARFVADGQIPPAGSGADVGKVWAVKGGTHSKGATLTFAWSEPVVIAEIVYYGRTAFLPNENWKDYQVLLDGAAKPVLVGQLKSGHGPQRIALPKPAIARKLTVKFTSSYGGANPGASEVRIYSSRATDAMLGKFSSARRVRRGRAPVASPVKDSPELAKRLQAGELGFTKILVIQRNSINCSHVYTYHSEGFGKGGGLYVLTLGEGENKLDRLVDAAEGQILDCNVSYDGKELLFSWKKSAKEKYRIFRMNTDGTELTPITDGTSNDMNACWLPDGGIAFLSDRKPAFAYCWVTTSPILFRCDGDGGNVVRLSANYLNDFTPSVMADGRILYSRWEYVDKPAIPIQSLWTMNADGTGVAGFFGNRVLSPATFMEARQIPGSGKVLCVLTSHNGPCRGAVGIIDTSHGPNAQEGITNLTPEVRVDPVDRGSGNNVRGPYESPYPIDGKHYLVSRGGEIQVRDYAMKSQATVLAKSGAMGYYNPQPIRAMRKPMVRRFIPPTESNQPWATMIMQDVYVGLAPHVQRGRIKQIAIVQELEKSVRAEVSRRSFGFQFPTVSCGATYSPKKVWGYAKVEADGSANFRVPARVPIYFMALDEHGRALQRMRSHTHLMPDERQSCVGCHADRNTVAAAGGARPTAAIRAPQELDKPEWGVGGFSYARIVQPVLDEHCVKCHSPGGKAAKIDLSGDKTDFFNVSYDVLARERWGREGSPYVSWIPTYNGHEANILKVTPKTWGSPVSKLANVVLSGHPDAEGKPRVRLPDAAKRRIFAWIDLNVPYYGTSRSNHYTRPGCRQLMPPAFEKTLADVAKRRCADCHKPDSRGRIRLPRKVYTRITNPRLNTFLTAPLSRSAGGTEACGKIVFKTTDDPDYQAILKTFRPIAELIEKTPRMDMPGAVVDEPCPDPSIGAAAPPPRVVANSSSGAVNPAKAKEPKRMWANSFLWAKAPELVVDKWLSAKPETKGKYVLIEFWATWCGPCRRSIPLLNRFHEKYGDELVVIGVSDESEADVRKLIDPKINYYSAIDTQARTKKKFGVFGIPHVVILEPGGYVIWEGFPLLPGYELTEQIIERILVVGRKLKAQGRTK